MVSPTLPNKPVLLTPRASALGLALCGLLTLPPQAMAQPAAAPGAQPSAPPSAPTAGPPRAPATAASAAAAAASAPVRPAAPAAPAGAAPSAAAAAPTPAAGAQRPSAPAAAGTPPATATPGQRVEVTGGRLSDTEQRRQATASKIVIGREEIDKFGDATLGEVLRRLPGVTTPGAPGRGGPPRLRGLGGGFTQLLIDGQRMPPGFSLESLTPEQVERIEILRAPTAETGARAIAGTINIITREGFKVRLNDLRMGTGLENGQNSGGINWSHNNTAGALTYTVNASLFARKGQTESRSNTEVSDITTGELLEDRSGNSVTNDERFGTNLSGRLMWRLNETGDSLTLMPSVFHTESHGDTRFDLVERRRQPTTRLFYDQANNVTDGRFTTARVGVMYRQRLGAVRVEVNGNGGSSRSVNDSLRKDSLANGSALPRELSDSSNTRENSLNLTLKFTGVAGGGAPGMPGAPGAAATPRSEHNLVSGAEVEALSRSETRVSMPDPAGFGDNLKASSLRLAAYVQDEWQLNPNWGLNGGLRWEGITTHGDSANGERPTNRSSVWTPLLHAVWKHDPKSRDQIRISLTRSYRSPPLASLIARPTFNREYPLPGTNIETAPDNAGNPNLKPELATGIDVAIERYLDAGGVLSANVFHRNISNLIRGKTEEETLSQDSGLKRFVRRQRNIGDATTSGIELEAKFRLDQLISAAPRVEMRSNLSVFASRVKSVPGPNNRLDQQAKATANLGADYRLRGVPLTLGGNVNWVPGYTTRLEVDETTSVTTKQVWDVYALWTISPTVGLRLLGSNLDPRDYVTTNVNESINAATRRNERIAAQSFTSGYQNWQLRLELKL